MLISKQSEYRSAPIYNTINPLAIPTIRVVRQTDGTATSAKKPVEDIVKRVGLALLGMLKNEYGDLYSNPTTMNHAHSLMAQRNASLAKIHPSDAINSLKEELKSYARGYPPFDRPFDLDHTTSLLAWWERVHRSDDTNILAVISQLCFS